MPPFDLPTVLIPPALRQHAEEFCAIYNPGPGVAFENEQSAILRNELLCAGRKGRCQELVVFGIARGGLDSLDFDSLSPA